MLASACGSAGVVELTIPGTPAYLVYRDSRGVWLTPDHAPDGTWLLAVEDDYEVWSVCRGPGEEFYVQGLRATLDDGLEQSLGALPGLAGCSDEAPAITLGVTGAMLQAGTIDTCAGTQTSLNPTGWEFDMVARPGRCDLIATDFDHTSTLVATRLVRRELELTNDTVLGAIDLFDGIPLVPLSVPITGSAEGSILFGSVSLTSGNTTAQLAGLPGRAETLIVPFVPPEHGRLVAHASAFGALTSQVADVPVTRGLSSITLLAPAPAEWIESSQSITWRSIDDRRTAVELSITGDHPTQARRIVATRRWLDAHRDHELAPATDLPGYDPAWQIDTSRPYVATFSLIADEDGGHYTASYVLDASATGARSAR